MVEARAPGRVNLIGEHTDYNGGYVLPCAIAYQTCVLAERIGKGKITVHSTSEGWEKYVKGVLSLLASRGINVDGARFEISGDVPIGAGLSSSASLEIGVGLAALELARAHMERLDLALLAQRAEVEFAGTRCGIMDQFAVLFGRESHAVFLDTRDLSYELVEVPKDVSVVICNTMVKHENSNGEYNRRRNECERAVAFLQKNFDGIEQLRDVTNEQLEKVREVMPPLLYRRAHHVVSENNRVLEARRALRAKDPVRFGALMNASHESLRDDYQVSCTELDTMVELARTLPGIFGARMTGGGFGGCTVNLVAAEEAKAFGKRISNHYVREVGIVPEIYDGTPAAGARVVHG